MSTLHIEAPTEVHLQSSLPPNSFTEGMQSTLVNGGESVIPEQSPYSDLTIESLGDAALTLTSEPTASDDRLTDERGNLLPVQTTDLREVANRAPWALEGPSVHRFVSLDVPTAIVKAYRTVPPGVRGSVVGSARRGPTSHDALAKISAGGGWKALAHYAIGPNAHGGWFDWAHYT